MPPKSLPDYAKPDVMRQKGWTVVVLSCVSVFCEARLKKRPMRVVTAITVAARGRPASTALTLAGPKPPLLAWKPLFRLGGRAIALAGAVASGRLLRRQTAVRPLSASATQRQTKVFVSPVFLLAAVGRHVIKVRRKQVRPPSPPATAAIREIRRFSSPARVPTTWLFVADAGEPALRRYKKAIPRRLTARRA